MVRLTY